MKNKIIVLSMSLCLLVASTAFSFAAEGPNIATSPNKDLKISKSVAPRSNGLSIVSIKRDDSKYATVVFKNSTNQAFSDMLYVYDRQGNELDRIAFRLNANSTSNFGIYIGSNSYVVLETGNHGSFYMNIK